MTNLAERTDQHVSGSVGIALFPEDGRDAQTLMKNADTAMFHGKTQGKNTYQYFTAQMNIAVKRRMTLESALRRAVMNHDFLLHYQPQIDLDSGEILAVEALVRWKTEDGGMVSPGDFIPLDLARAQERVVLARPAIVADAVELRGGDDHDGGVAAARVVRQVPPGTLERRDVVAVGAHTVVRWVE